MEITWKLCAYIYKRLNFVILCCGNVRFCIYHKILWFMWYFVKCQISSSLVRITAPRIAQNFLCNIKTWWLNSLSEVTWCRAPPSYLKSANSNHHFYLQTHLTATLDHFLPSFYHSLAYLQRRDIWSLPYIKTLLIF